MTNGEHGRMLELKNENRRLRQELTDMKHSVRLLVEHSRLVADELQEMSEAVDELL